MHNTYIYTLIFRLDPCLKCTLGAHARSEGYGSWLYYVQVGAAHRFYESRRRLYLDSQPKRLDIVEKNKKSIKRKAMKMRVRVSVMVLKILIVIFLLCSSIIQGKNKLRSQRKRRNGVPLIGNT